GITYAIQRIKQYESSAVMESTGNYWILLYDMLDKSGIPVRLADLLRGDNICNSYVPDREKREIMRQRVGLVHERTRLKERVISIVDKYRYKSPFTDMFSNSGIKWLKAINVSWADRMAIDSLLAVIAQLNEEIQKFDNKIASIAVEDSNTRLLMTMPGINFVTAQTIMAEIVDIRRFTTPYKLISYAGLTPSRRDSGNKKTRGMKITHTGSSWLRYAMVEAANTTIIYDDRIKTFYTRVAKRRGPQKAKVAAAREMLFILWQMLTKGEPYRGSNPRLTQEKYKSMERKAKLA
ncbi:MAG: IS110 family transposase, partial [Nitrososphaerota archaeon]|nr:IS110 family transposase [Nitrososphaerota archaeon]